MCRISPLVSAFVLLIISHASLGQSPMLHEITYAEGKIILLGGTEAPANSWIEQSIQTAINASNSLWLELPPEDPDQGIADFRTDIYPSVDMHPVAIELGYGNLRFGDYMDVTMGERSVVESQRLDLNGNWYQPMKPWVAYYYFAYNFWDKQALNLVSPAAELLKQFRASGKTVHSLFADRAEFFRHMSSMSDTTQTQFFQSLYNIFDWQRSGQYVSRLGWLTGTPDDTFIEAHRQQTPLYYRFMFEQRNREIAEQLLTLLEQGGSHFLYLDVNRTLGPHSIQRMMEELGATVVSK